MSQKYRLYNHFVSNAIIKSGASVGFTFSIFLFQAIKFLEFPERNVHNRIRSGLVKYD
ncbi:hypothetical protein J27TS8_34400 [Robertmurraya siralis]|uniref:Uncharacterized protein n=1 Tax=Robertmurraya siralis TaxID=77777 RepID=A0A919WKR3_9BACI|nr:hypothetical protein J27TS8_34400 [Robertmurraya siralis]